MRKTPTTKSLLGTLAKYAARGLTIALEMQRYQKIYLAGGGHQQVAELKLFKSRSEYRNTINQLKRAHYIATKKQGQRLIISLTNKGKAAGLLLSLKKSPPLPHGYSTLVIFDIPEETRRARRILRLFLKQGEFKQLQKSVWMLSRDVTPILRQFLNKNKLSSWVKVFKAEISE